MNGAIHQSHKLSSPELRAMHHAKKNDKPYMIDGLPYELGSWEPKAGRVLITLVPFRRQYAAS